MSQQPASEPVRQVPVFTSREEEAAWWDSHDLADYQDDFTTIEARFADKLSDQGTSPVTRISER